MSVYLTSWPVGVHSLLPAAFRGAASPWSLRCPCCAAPKRGWESACKPCRLRRLADREAADLARAELHQLTASGGTL